MILETETQTETQTQTQTDEKYGCAESEKCDGSREMLLLTSSGSAGSCWKLVQGFMYLVKEKIFCQMVGARH